MIVIGAGPNGLAAAIELTRAGYSVSIFEANETVGGGTRSRELTLPGFLHDICSAVHPLAVNSPAFSQLPLENYGVQFINPPAALAHPFDDDSTVLLTRSVDVTAENFGEDADTYKKLMKPLVESWQHLAEDLLAPPRIPHHPLKIARFGFYGIRSAKSLTKSLFRNERTRTFFAGLASHSFLSLDMLATSAFALVMGTLGHAVGWPVPRGGAQKISDALASYLQECGAEIRTGVQVNSIEELPRAKIIMCDITPRQLIKIAGNHFSAEVSKKAGTIPLWTGGLQD